MLLMFHFAYSLFFFFFFFLLYVSFHRKGNENTSDKSLWRLLHMFLYQWNVDLPCRQTCWLKKIKILIPDYGNQLQRWCKTPGQPCMNQGRSCFPTNAMHYYSPPPPTSHIFEMESRNCSRSICHHFQQYKIVIVFPLILSLLSCMQHV